jgi:hypothetical protein
MESLTLSLTPMPQMFMDPSSLLIHLSSILDSLLTVIHHYLVIIMSIGALRMYRGLVDSAALSGPAWVVDGAGGLSTKEDIFARPTACREQDGARGAALDPSWSIPNSQVLTNFGREETRC